MTLIKRNGVIRVEFLQYFKNRTPTPEICVKSVQKLQQGHQKRVF